MDMDTDRYEEKIKAKHRILIGNIQDEKKEKMDNDWISHEIIQK